MTSLFSDYADKLLDNNKSELYSPIQTIDAFDFITSTSFLSEDPWPAQRIIIKTAYNLWGIYPPDAEEEKLLFLLKNKWHIELRLDRTDEYDPVNILVLVEGRRSSKSTMTSWFATYGSYYLICKGDPQKYFNIRGRHPIHITHIAAAAKQATEVFTLTADNLKRVAFFRPYIDFDKDNASELRLFTPSDNLLNQQIRLRNNNVPRGMQKESTKPGSILINSITTSGATNRGSAIFYLMFSEFAHVQRAKFDLTKTDDQIAEENPQTDYALWKAMEPSVKDFGTEGKIICESSPLEKGGEFYHQYCIAGGYEQENTAEIDPDPNYAVIQLATWEARPTLPQADFDRNFRTDPRGASMEYGAHFGNPSGQFISEAVINAIPRPGFPLILKNPGTYHFIISLDAGGKAKKKKDDAYAIAWGHCEREANMPEEEYKYWVDGMHGWHATVKNLGGGHIETISVDPNMVVQYILDLAQDLGGKNFISAIIYDQWNSQSSISTLQSYGYPAVETTFTNAYKGKIYSNFLAKAQLGQVYMYGEDIGGFIARWKLEMKYLQQDVSGDTVFYHHPATGPVTNDDYPDVCANLIYKLIELEMPTAESMYKAHQVGHKVGMFIPPVRHTPAPIRAGKIGNPRISSTFKNDRFSR
jgi:hypothetical protein